MRSIFTRVQRARIGAIFAALKGASLHVMLCQQTLRFLAAPLSLLYVSCGASVQAPKIPSPAVSATAPASAVVVATVKPVVAWAVGLDPLKIECANTGLSETARLYADDGTIDPAAAEAFSRAAADSNGFAPLKPRLLQLVVKAAHHFQSSTVIVVSGYRLQRGGKSDHHTLGEAIDFKIPGVDYRRLAAHLDSYPLTGVGIYTNTKTHYVHLDVRDRSYHWLDASPPGVTWREALLPDPSQRKRDLSYTPESDLPIEGQE
jgi:uncharacterized protein YcbK (DUF882 family)